MLFVALAQIAALFQSAHDRRQTWSCEIDRLKSPDGSTLGTRFKDGCEIRIRIEPATESQVTP